MIKFVKSIWGDNLYKNSIYLILNAFVIALFGFVFWTICARTFTSAEVGLATAIISVIGLISSLSFLGLNIGFLRYLPNNKDSGEIIFNGLFFAALINIVLSIVFLLGIDIFSPSLNVLFNSISYYVMFVAFSLVWLLFSLTNSVLVAKRKSNIVLIKSTIYSIVKISLLFVFVGVFGILISWYLACFLALIFGMLFFKFSLKFDLKPIKKMFKFSFYNYFSSIFASLPVFILPLIVLHNLGASQNAYFYVAWTIASMLFVIPGAVAQNFLTEGSYSLKSTSFKKSLLFSFGLVCLGLIGVFVLGKFVLNIFNSEYVAGLSLLYVLALSTIPYGFNQIYISFLNLKKKIGKVVMLNFIIALFTILFSVWFVNYGLVYVGLSWLGANLIGALAIGVGEW